jgi:hypothetical protein
LIGNINYSLIVGCILSVIGLLSFIAVIFKKKSMVSLSGFIIFIVLYIACLFVVLIEPLTGWDARSIWFFHAKMIFYSASIDAGGNWSLPSIGFSHPDYPKLIPIIASQIAFVASYWNEYLPKMSLAVLLLPAMLSLISILSDKWWHIIFISFPLLFTQEWLTNGYMDGYLALYAGLATFFWGKWLDDKNYIDLISGIVFTGVVLNLKNEGMLYSLIILCLILFFVYINRHKSNTAYNINLLEIIPLSVVSISGFYFWSMKKYIYNLQNDLHIGSNSIDKLLERLTDGSLYIILSQLYVTYNINLSLGIFLFSLVVTLRMGKRSTSGSIFCIFTGILYFCGIVLIYLATPYDLTTFHLPTGNRTMLPVHIILLSAAFSLYCVKSNKLIIDD